MVIETPLGRKPLSYSPRLVVDGRYSALVGTPPLAHADAHADS